MTDKYILDGHVAVPEPDLMKWAQWFEDSKSIVVNKTTLESETEVSTVFLGLDYSYGSGPPMLFETMVFGGDMNKERKIYTTWDEAERGHEKMCERVKKHATTT